VLKSVALAFIENGMQSSSFGLPFGTVGLLKGELTQKKYRVMMVQEVGWSIVWMSAGKSPVRRVSS
jgi:hypothetical protein